MILFIGLCGRLCAFVVHCSSLAVINYQREENINYVDFGHLPNQLYLSIVLLLKKISDEINVSVHLARKNYEENLLEIEL